MLMFRVIRYFRFKVNTEQHCNYYDQVCRLRPGVWHFRPIIVSLDTIKKGVGKYFPYNTICRSSARVRIHSHDCGRRLSLVPNNEHVELARSIMHSVGMRRTRYQSCPNRRPLYLYRKGKHYGLKIIYFLHVEDHRYCFIISCLLLK